MIENEPAGPRIDAWFCELVMGWHKDKLWKSWANAHMGLEYSIREFNPSSNIAHAIAGENLIKEPRDRYRYTKCLDEIVNHDRGKPFEYDYLFDLIHATAHQRTRALLLWAIEKGE